MRLLAGSLGVQAQIHKMERTDSSMTTRTYNLNPVVVTGSGHHQRLKSTATPVHVLSAQEIHEQGITNFGDALTRMMPQASMAPNSMGTFLRLNGLGNKYILILINGQKLSGDISNNVDLSRINMSRVKRIEILDGAASSLYGSDAIAGVINIITDQPTQHLISVASDTRVSGHGQLTEDVTLDIYKNGFGSYTSFTHDRADSYQNNNQEYIKGSDTELQPTIAPLFTGYRSNIIGQKFTYAPTDHLALNAGLDYSYKITSRPDTRSDITGGTDYEMRYKGFRWNIGGIYKFGGRGGAGARGNSLQATFTVDRFRYGKEYDVATNDYAVGDYVQSKKQRMMDGELKAILGLTRHSTTIFGANWRKDYLTATSGNIDQNVYTLAAYAQHEQRDLQQPSDAQGSFDVCPGQFPFPCHLFLRLPCPGSRRTLLPLLLRQPWQGPDQFRQSGPLAGEEPLRIPQCRIPLTVHCREPHRLSQPYQRYGDQRECPCG